MTAENKHLIKCTMRDCQYYSEEINNTKDENEIQVYCSSPNWVLLSLDQSNQACPSYHLDWAKRAALKTEIKPKAIEQESTESTAALIIRTEKPATPSVSTASLARAKKQNKEKEKTNIKSKPQPDIPQKPPVDFAPPTEHKLEQPIPFRTMKTFQPPEEIVRQFIESWNNQDFASEYRCLSHTLPLPPLGDYILSRKSIYQALFDQLGKGNPPQQQAEIKRVEFRLGGVLVECFRKDLLGTESKEYLQEFQLRREDGGWKITRVHSKRIKII